MENYACILPSIGKKIKLPLESLSALRATSVPVVSESKKAEVLGVRSLF